MRLQGDSTGTKKPDIMGMLKHSLQTVREVCLINSSREKKRVCYNGILAASELADK